MNFVEEYNLPEKEGKYDRETKNNIETLYIVASITWLVLTVVLGLWKYDDILLWAILLIPLLVFAINYFNLEHFPLHLENQMLRGNLLSFAFIVAVVLIHWNSPFDKQARTEFYKILITAFILLMISLVDLWVDEKKMLIVKHMKTALHTASLTLLAVALYLYYTYQRDQIE